MNAELWGILSGLSLAWDMRYCRVEVEADSLVVNILSSSEEMMVYRSSLIMAIRELLDREWIIRAVMCLGRCAD